VREELDKGECEGGKSWTRVSAGEGRVGQG